MDSSIYPWGVRGAVKPPCRGAINDGICHAGHLRFVVAGFDRARHDRKGLELGTCVTTITCEIHKREYGYEEGCGRKPSCVCGRLLYKLKPAHRALGYPAPPSLSP